jgi:nucleoside-diphosphate-sugar epimerase
MRHALVFGGSGQIGMPLVARLQAAGWRVTALSRSDRIDEPGLHWLRGEFARLPDLPRSVDAIFSCGPLDLFSHWYAAAGADAARVVAFGSTSAEVKVDSADPGERELAGRLHRGEARVLDAARQRGAQATVLRPTLVYGAGQDHTLTRIATLAQRWDRMILPRRACGLRQPVHVDDLAEAAFRAAQAPESAGNTYALPGGETLPYRDMVARVLATLQPPPSLVELPSPLFALLLRAAQSRGIATGLGRAAVARMRSDLVFDIAPAQRDFGYAPRAFRPERGMFLPREPVARSQAR